MRSYYFTEDHELFRQGLRQFLDKQVMPNIDQWEEEGRIPKELWKEFGEMGYLGLNYPEEYGGMGADFFYSVIFIEEVSKCFSGGFAITPIVQQYMASPYIHKAGSEYLKDRYLRKAISGEWVCSITISEPGAGSDVANIQTTAIADGDDYIVNGSKTFITSGVYGDFLVTVVKTDPEKGAGGISLLIIDRNSEGVSATKLKKLGWHASDTAELAFDHVRVPKKNLVGAEGQGFYLLMGGLQLERLAGAISAVAACEQALQYTLDYMSQRHAFGRPINKFQVLRHRIADMATEITATKYFVYHLCRVHDEGGYAVKECSMAKLKATELADKVMYQCLQMFGGYGYMEEYKIARMFRDARVGTIGGGSSEIMREIISKMVIDDTAYDSAFEQPHVSSGKPKKKIGVHSSVEVEQKKEAQESIVAEANGNGSSPLAETTEKVVLRAEKAPAFGAVMKFRFDEGVITLDGKGASNGVSNDDIPADCTVGVKLADFEALLDGKLDPMTAFLGGKFSVEGDMSLAMKLPGFFKAR